MREMRCRRVVCLGLAWQTALKGCACVRVASCLRFVVKYCPCFVPCCPCRFRVAALSAAGMPTDIIRKSNAKISQTPIVVQLQLRITSCVPCIAGRSTVLATCSAGPRPGYVWSPPSCRGNKQLGSTVNSRLAFSVINSAFPVGRPRFLAR
jgi:hypothetical protein